MAMSSTTKCHKNTPSHEGMYYCCNYLVYINDCDETLIRILVVVNFVQCGVESIGLRDFIIWTLEGP